MPLLAKKIFNCVKPLKDLKSDETVYSIQHTKEQFRSRLEYEQRHQLYKQRIWTCQSTGHVNLTHEEAYNSERAVLKTLKEQFVPCYDKPILELVHHSTKSLECLVDQAWLMLQQVLVVGEKVLLKVKAGGKTMKAIIVKVDTAGYEGNPTSNCSSPSSDKENSDKDDNKKWVPPKLLPYKYSIRFEHEDSVIHSVPAEDLNRGDKPPSKELLRLFIRTYAVRAGQSGNSPWIVDDVQVKKFDLQSKFASFLLSPVKWRADEVAKKIDEEVNRLKPPSKASPRIKTKMDAKEEKRKEKAKKSITKIKEKGERAKAAKEAVKKKSEVTALDSGDDSEVEAKPVNKTIELDSDSDTPLSKYQLTPKKKSVSEKSSKEKQKYPLSLADLKKKLEKKKQKQLAKLKKKEEKGEHKKKSKEQNSKQLTLFDLSKKKGMSTPEKKHKSPLKDRKTPDSKKKMMSPPRTPIIVQKIQKALKRDDKAAIGLYCTQAAKILTTSMRAKLAPDIKERVQKKYDILQERQKLAKMSESERKDYLAKQAAEKKEQVRLKMKARMKNLKKRWEDTDLDLKPLPQPRPVITPDGMPNETFGDVTMITEFIACYSGLLMPDDEYPIYTDALMKALAAGKDGFAYLSRVLSVLLQTLLQDQIAEDYQDLSVSLADIPVNPCTASELVRLCLRKRDVSDEKSDDSFETEEAEEDEVPEELIQTLETQELYQLSPEQKLQILKGLCLRIMGTYSVQDYMEERQQESSRLWREKLAQFKENKDKRAAKKAEEKTQKGSAKENKEKEKAKKKEKAEDNSGSMLLTQFYGKKGGDEGTASGNTSEAAPDTDDHDTDMASVVKRRRITTAKAQEERRQRDIEERIRRDREAEIMKEQKEKENFEKEFTEGIYLAKVVQRQVPIGTDRNHARYWIFSDVTAGLYVEKGWIGEEIEYTCKKPGEESVEDSSSSDDDDDDQPDGEGAPSTAATKKNKQNKVGKCVDTTFPHVGQNLWFTFDSMKDVDALIESLHPQASRESTLKKELQKRYSDISSAIIKNRRANRELRDSDGDVEMIGALKKELLETEMRLRNGGLGGVMDFPSWSTRLETSTAADLSALGDCLLETQENVVAKFRDGIMVHKRKKKTEVKEEVKEEEEEVEGEASTTVAPGIADWREAVKSATTLSRLHVMLGILDSCIKWEKSAENAKCKICRKKGDEDRLLLCDDCNQAFHMYCLRPALADVPRGDWHCPACAPQYRKRVRDVPGRYKENSQDDSQVDSGEDEEEVKVAKTQSIKHEKHCVECGADDSLIECAECPSVYHLECHEPPLRHPPRGRWVCNDCKNGVTRKTRRGSQRGARKVNRAAAKRKKYESSSEEEDSDEDEEEESEEEEEEVKPPPKKVAKTSKAATSKRTSKTKSESPKTGPGRSKGRKSVPTPEIIYDSKPRVSRRAPSELSVMEDIIDRMLAFKDAWPFYLLVSKKDVPDYYDIIKQPISFQKIKDRLNCLVYGSPQEVLNAVALLFKNAVEYNKIGSDIYDCVVSSENHFINLLNDHLPIYSYQRTSCTNGHDSMDMDDST